MPLTRPNQGHLCPKIILGIQFEIDLGFVSDIANWQLTGPRYVKTPHQAFRMHEKERWANT